MAKTYYKLSEITFQTIPTVHNFQNIVNKKFGRLVTLGYAGDKSWFCECKCGNIVKVTATMLKTSRTRSCGCLHNEQASKRRFKHGLSHTPEYTAYSNAKGRCRNPNRSNYKFYGGRGIEFRFTSFKEFLKEIGKRPDKNHSIDRIDFDGHYERGNIRWATPKQQGNNRSNTAYITIDGEKRPVSYWSKTYGNSRTAIQVRRNKLGWCDDCSVKLRIGKKCIHR